MDFTHERTRRGFALILALSLLSFIILLVLSLSLLVSVETKNFTASKGGVQARYNARLALAIALGDLQKYAGPDQRSTTTATANTQLQQTSKDGARHWTGVWANAAGADELARAPVLLNWLVSGNEGEPFTIANDGSVQVPLAQTIAFPPAAQTVIKSGSVTINNERAAILIGEGSALETENFVIAPLVSLENNNNRSKGSYAFWVGDEGLKAHVGLSKAARRSLEPDNSNYNANALLRMSSNQGIQAGGALVYKDSLNVNIWGNDYNLRNLDFVDDLEKISDLDGFDLLDATPPELIKNRLHDLTTLSKGLQTNPIRGGLKTDLSLAFELPETSFDETELMANSESGHILRYEGIYGPKWKLFRNYYRLYQFIESPNDFPQLETQLVTPLPPEDPDLGIAYLFGETTTDVQKTLKTGNETLKGYLNAHSLAAKVRDVIFPELPKLAPVLVNLTYLISADTQLLPAPVNVSRGGQSIPADRKLRIIMDPVVKLWNPYNVRLKFDAFTIRTSHLPLGVNWYLNYPTTVSGTPTTHTSPKGPNANVRGFYNRFLGLGSGNFEKWLDSLIVSIGDPNGLVLEPGEVKIFSSGASSPVDFQQQIDLVEGWEDQGGFQIDAVDAQDFSLPGDMKYRVPVTADSGFAVELFTAYNKDGVTNASGWTNLRVSTYLFGEGKYSKRFQVKESGSKEFYSTSFHEIETKDMPLSGFGVDPNSAIIRSPSSSYWPIPQPGEKQYLMAIELFAKAEDELEAPLPLAQFSPTAYVHSYKQNSVPSLRLGPATKMGYRKINNQAEADIQFNTATNQAYFGESHGTSGQTHVPFLDVPYMPLFSIGQLQNVDTSIYAVDPLLAVGNSSATPMLSADKLSGLVNGRSRIDTAYLLNQALWDDYYFSTIAPQTTEVFREAKSIESVLNGFFFDGDSLINPNMAPQNGSESEALSQLIADGELALNAPERSAAYLAQEGQFNINSTSVEAWVAMLSGNLGAEIPFIERSTGLLSKLEETGAPISRFSLPVRMPETDNNWDGYRSLSPSEVRNLATEIVNEIRKRGPFLSLSDFVNRDVQNGETSGLLDSAIQATAINSDFSNLVQASDVPYLPQNARANVEGSSAVGAAKYLLQGDVLSMIGHRLSPRSDTFRIRAYGESTNPGTNEAEQGTWIEAIVQRVPAYIDETVDKPWDAPTGANITFGRRFVVVSTRIIDKDDV